MTEPLVLVEIMPAGYAVVTLNRPQAMNALSIALCHEFANVINRLSADPTVRVLIVTGAGRAFCAGLDLKELGNSGAVSDFMQESDPVQALRRFEGPVIGAINGVAVTGGFELALACDMLLASTEARFADTHARIGVIPGWGMSQTLSRIVGPSRAMEISLAGNYLPASEACRLGIVNRVTAPDQLMEDARKLATDMLSAVEGMLPAYKRLIRDGYRLPYGEALALEQERGAAWNGALTAEQIASRRAAVQARGQKQAHQDH